MKKIKVLMVAGTMNVGGQENQIMNILRYADREQFQIDYTSTVEDAFYRQEIESLGGKCIQIPEIDWKCPQKYCNKLECVMKKGHYDIVHSHELFHTGITLKIAAKAGVPIRIAHSHSGSDGDGQHRAIVRKIYNRLMRNLILKYSTEQIACSTNAGSFLYGDTAINQPNYHLIFNSVNTQQFLECYGKSGTLGVNHDWKSVLHVGHVIPIKNQDFLVDVAEVLRNRGEKINIFCVGPGNDDYIAQVNEKIIAKHLESYIALIGLRRDVPDLMRKADAFVLPSRYEGMPLVMIEAQASGLPCVAADTFSREVDFGIGQVQWMKLEAGAEAWADALVAAVQRERAAKNEVEKAIVQNGFDSRLYAERVLSVYRKALGQYYD